MVNTLQEAEAAAAAGDDAGEGSIEDSSQQQQQQQQQQVLQMVKSQPQEAFCMFGWAQQFVNQGAIRVPQQQQQQQQQQGLSLVLVPGLEHVPKVG
jgi:hypothetical protein